MIYRILIVLMLFPISQLQAKDIVYAAGEIEDYYTDLLSLALSYSPEKNYQVKSFPNIIPKQRFFDLMAEDKGVDVITASSTLLREDHYQAIYFPILRGLKGWRVPIINQAKAELFSNVDTLEKLKALTVLQFHTWTTTEIFEANQFTVIKGTSYPGMFKMLKFARGDYLPRSVLEAEKDLSLFSDLNLLIDPYILIKFPSAYYFYVKKDNYALAEDINKGLEMALQDGSFDALFEKNFGNTIRALKLKKRRVFNLQNPFLPNTIPLKRNEFETEHWLDKLISTQQSVELH